MFLPSPQPRLAQRTSLRPVERTVTDSIVHVYALITGLSRQNGNLVQTGMLSGWARLYPQHLEQCLSGPEQSSGNAE